MRYDGIELIPLISIDFAGDERGVAASNLFYNAVDEEVERLLNKIDIPDNWSKEGKETYSCWLRKITYEVVKYELHGKGTYTENDIDEWIKNKNITEEQNFNPPPPDTIEKILFSEK